MVAVFIRPPKIVLGVDVVVERRERQAHGSDDPVGEDDGVQVRWRPRLRPCRAGRYLQVAVDFLEVQEESRDEDCRESAHRLRSSEGGKTSRRRRHTVLRTPRRS